MNDIAMQLGTLADIQVHLTTSAALRDVIV